MSASPPAAPTAPSSPAPPGAVWAVVVTYRPDLPALRALLDALAPQVERVVIVDNGSGPEAQAFVAARAGASGGEAVLWPENRGLGAAQAEGVARARAGGAGAVLLMDQDSRPAPDMVARLLAALGALRARGERVAAVGPRFSDALRPGCAVFVRFDWRGLRRVEPDPATGLAPVDYVIASGALIPMDALDAVGPPSAAMFIDLLDMEWGFRAQARGWRSFGVDGARMDHRIGDATIPVLGRRVAVHSPVRAFYEARNAVWLWRRPDVPLPWKLHFGLRLAAVTALSLLAAPGRGRRAALVARGIAWGLRGRLGPLD